MMRIDKLELLAFGPFRDEVLDFSAPGLHVVFGPNAAGKTTTLRAITNLLYGIPATTPDAHAHKPSDLRIGGVLVGPDGTRIHVVRRKSSSKTGPKSLLGPDGQPASDEALVRLLGGTTEDGFRRGFAMDQASLALGAEALLAGQGDVGETLFDASLGGGTDVRAVLAELEAEAAAIYRPQGRRQLLNDALTTFETAKKDLRKAQTLPEDYLTRRRTIEATEARLDALRRERTELAREQGRLDRMQKLLPLERERELVARTLEGLGPIAEESGRVRSLPAMLETHDSAQADLSRCEKELDVLRGSLREAARRASVDQEEPPRPVVRPDARAEARIRRLLTDRASLAQKISSEKGQLADEERELRRSTQAATAAPSTEDDRGLAKLAQAIASAREAGDIEARMAQGAAKAKRRRETLEVSLASLGRFHGTAEDLERLAVPSKEAIAAVVSRAVDLDRTLSRRTERLDVVRTELRGMERQIAELEGEFAPPRPEELRSARMRRDEAWDALRSGNGAADPTLATDFERAMLAVDGIVDRMLGDAQRVASLAGLRAAREALASELVSTVEEVEETRRLRAGCDADHVALWAARGIEAASPAEMVSWLDGRARILESLATLRDAEHDVQDLAARCRELRALLEAAIVGSGAPLPEDGTPVIDLVHAVECRKGEIDEAHRIARETADLVAKLSASVEARRASVDDAERRLDGVREELDLLLAPFGVDGRTTTEEIDAVLRALGDLAALNDKNVATEAEIARLSTTIAAFEAHVAGLVRELAPDLVEVRVEDAARELTVRAQTAEPLVQRRKTLDERISDLRQPPFEAGEAESLVDPVVVEERLLALAKEVVARDAEIERLVADLAVHRNELRGVDGRSGAETAAFEAESALSKVRAHVERFARAKLASVLLGREIARFRDEHQGPLLASTSKIFARLTRGSFVGVRAGLDDKDRPALECIRDGGESVAVSGLSEGTRVQLYLALRLASVLKTSAVRGALPLVLDDLFVTFDDDRAAEGLAILAEAASQVQVLFFTHHTHLVELARRRVPSSLLHVHRLASRASDGQRPESASAGA